MAKPIRNPQAGRETHTTIPAEYVEEAAIVPSPTAVGDMPSPEHNQVDEIGRTMGVQEEDSGALRTSAEILARRDQHRGHLDESPDPNPETRRR